MKTVQIFTVVIALSVSTSCYAGRSDLSINTIASYLFGGVLLFQKIPQEKVLHSDEIDTNNYAIYIPRENSGEEYVTANGDVISMCIAKPVSDVFFFEKLATKIGMPDMKCERSIEQSSEKNVLNTSIRWIFKDGVLLYSASEWDKYASLCLMTFDELKRYDKSYTGSHTIKQHCGRFNSN